MAKRGGYRAKAGRPRGPHQSTIEKQLIAERTLHEARATGKKLAKEVLEEFMFLFGGIAASYQPLPPNVQAPAGHVTDEVKFVKYASLAVEAAKALAPYQSPTFRAMNVTVTPGDQQPPPGRPGDNATVINIDDVKVVQRTYLAMVKAGNKR